MHSQGEATVCARLASSYAQNMDFSFKNFAICARAILLNINLHDQLVRKGAIIMQELQVSFCSTIIQKIMKLHSSSMEGGI